MNIIFALPDYSSGVIEVETPKIILWDVVDYHIQRIVLATEETTVKQRVSHRPTKCQSRLWSQRGTEVNGSHHGDNPLPKPTGIQIATKLISGPTNREHRKLIGVKTMSLGTNYSCSYYREDCLMCCPTNKVIKGGTQKVF